MLIKLNPIMTILHSIDTRPLEPWLVLSAPSDVLTSSSGLHMKISGVAGDNDRWMRQRQLRFCGGDHVFTMLKALVYPHTGGRRPSPCSGTRPVLFTNLAEAAVEPLDIFGHLDRTPSSLWWATFLPFLRLDFLLEYHKLRGHLKQKCNLLV